MSMFVANWKMNLLKESFSDYVNTIQEELLQSADKNVVLCPPFTHLQSLQACFSDNSISLGAQSSFFQDSGAYTGEISAPMLRDVSCQYVIVGHSERRGLFSESDSIVEKKAIQIINHNLIPIICLGESLDARESGSEIEFITKQLDAVFSQNINVYKKANFVLAYEPIWAIGTGRVATPQQAQAVHKQIKRRLNEFFPNKEIPVLYGGSVKPENASELLSEPDIDGFLVGGASLDSASFVKIMQA